MAEAENHLILIDAARGMSERGRQLMAATNSSTAIEYEDLNDTLGQTLECVVAFEFADGSRLLRRDNMDVWANDAWYVQSSSKGDGLNPSKIKATAANRKALRAHAREALAAYSGVMTWLLLDADGDLSLVVEPQGQTVYTGDDVVLATTGGFHKAHGDGAVVDPATGRPYKTQSAYLVGLLGRAEYDRVFGG